jgi:hypothetical protein
MDNHPLRPPDNVMAEANRLAEANGTSLNQSLYSLIAGRIGEMRAMTEVRAQVAGRIRRPHAGDAFRTGYRNLPA